MRCVPDGSRLKAARLSTYGNCPLLVQFRPSTSTTSFPSPIQFQTDCSIRPPVLKTAIASVVGCRKASRLPIEVYGGEAMSKRFCSVLRLGGSRIKLILILVSVATLLRVVGFAQNSFNDAHVPTQLMAEAEPHGTMLAASGSIRPVIKTSVDLVLVPVTVTDPMQRLVTGLGPNNFQVFENRKPQQIKHFSSEDVPVSLGIIVDTSGSMSSKMDRVREAVKEFCDSANPEDEFFVITFSEEPHLVQNFTNSAQDIEGRLVFAIPKGRTSLLDAIYMGVSKMRDAKYSKKALLILSDGGDNHSRYREQEVKSAVKESDVMFYAIGTFDRYVPTQEEMLGPQLLSDMADTTGGRAFILDDVGQMPALARRIGMELRTQYVLGYSPEKPPHDGKWHKINVKLKLPRKLDYLRARSKEGYYASEE
jgi:Ca-activated chloride channel homolog